VIGREHPSAAQRISAVREQRAVEAAADQRLRLVDHDVPPRQLRVTNQERRARERSNAATDEIRLHVLPRSAIRIVVATLHGETLAGVALDQAQRA
jgi:hypothetical protein